MAKYNVGDKVRVKKVVKDTYPSGWNSGGEMDHWCGQIMTIRAIESDGDYRMKEKFHQKKHSKF